VFVFPILTTPFTTLHHISLPSLLSICFVRSQNDNYKTKSKDHFTHPLKQVMSRTKYLYWYITT